MNQIAILTAGLARAISGALRAVERILTPAFDPHKPVNRWTSRRKLGLLVAFDSGKITAEDMRVIHDISPEELADWRRRNSNGGLVGLRTRRARTVAKRKLAPRRPKPVKPVEVEPPKVEVLVPRSKYQMTVSRQGEPDLVFNLEDRRRMSNWFDMYKINAAHNNTISAVVVVGRDGQIVAQWYRPLTMHR